MIKFIVILLTPLFFLIARAARAQTKPISESEIKAAVQECVQQQRRAPGIVVGLIDGQESKIIAYGVRENGKPEPVDGNSIFEIGSVTKVFTTIQLQQMVDRGEVKLEDPISKYLPKSVKAPSRNGKEITLLDLATQHSGLPRLPDNLLMKDAANPYATYTVELLYAFLSQHELTRDPGKTYEYSNLGMGLLGHLLSLKTGMSYESLITQQLCTPLKMNDTAITLSLGMQSRLAHGHNAAGMPVANWDIPVLSGAGALRSSANDMLKFLAANMGETPLSATMARSQRPRESAGMLQKIGLGWHIDTVGDIVWHNGGTGGYHSYLGFSKKSGRGVVVLANSGNDIDDLGLYILGARTDLAKSKAAKQRTVATIDRTVYDQYVGEYQLGLFAKFIVTRDGDRLLAQLASQSAYEVYPESATNFFYTVVDAQLTFVKDAAGKVTHLILHQNGVDQKAVKKK